MAVHFLKTITPKSTKALREIIEKTINLIGIKE